MKETWLMICGSFGIIDRCLASSHDEASSIFKNRSRCEDWSESNIISEADHIHGESKHKRITDDFGFLTEDMVMPDIGDK